MSKSLLFWRNATQHSTISFFIFYAGQLNSWVFNIVSFYGAYILLTKNKHWRVFNIVPSLLSCI